MKTSSIGIGTSLTLKGLSSAFWTSAATVVGGGALVSLLDPVVTRGAGLMQTAFVGMTAVTVTGGAMAHSYISSYDDDLMDYAAPESRKQFKRSSTQSVMAGVGIPLAATALALLTKRPEVFVAGATALVATQAAITGVGVRAIHRLQDCFAETLKNKNAWPDDKFDMFPPSRTTNPQLLGQEVKQDIF